MPVNKELLRETLQLIKDNPQHWDQSEWHCGTSHCFAGFIECKVRGIPLTESVDELYLGIQDQDNLVNAILNYNATLDSREIVKFIYLNYIHTTNTELIASVALDLPLEDVQELFRSGNTLEDLERIVEELCAQE